MQSLSNTSKSTSQSLSNEPKQAVGGGLTWNEMTWTWDSERGTWDQPQYTLDLSGETKNNQSLTNEAKI